MIVARLALCWRGPYGGPAVRGAWWSSPRSQLWCPAGSAELNFRRLAPLLRPAFMPFGTGSLAWCSAGPGGGAERGLG
ncbi:hypothetical protein NDU88_011418 [Pleurodeles waltl]|uniref:Uncharacterized protein n=1 Tax=Pleurodeles waltl TaxID=8319 RepID=A0AAV7Q0P8_PLEWA|nr:hypothetical protein NDU88_011418 [Pleurodeles waltl]